MSDTQSAVPRRDKYENPLVSRYASKEMSYVWSPEKKFTTWRSLWIHLAEGQRELGLDISEEQIAELRRYRTNINYEVAALKIFLLFWLTDSFFFYLLFSCYFLTLNLVRVVEEE